MSTSNGGTGTGTDASTTIPGSIFPDDIPSTPSPSDNTDYTPSPTSSVSNNNGGGAPTQIEVNSTTQIVLITLGIAVGVLFLLGVAAAYYISHKNKRACLKKEEEDAAAAAAAAGTAVSKGEDLEKGGGNVGAAREGSGRGGGGEKEEVGGEWEEGEEEEDLTTLTMPVVIGRDLKDNGSFSSGGFNNEKGHAANGNRYYSASDDESAGFGQSRGSTPGPPEALGNHNNINDSPRTATGASALVARSQNTRNSFIDVAQVYAHRQSLYHPVDPAIAMQQRRSIIMVDNSGPGMYQQPHGEYPVTYQQQQQQQQFSQYEGDGYLGETAGSNSHSGQWPPSTPTENNSLLLDPFKTNNNSMASLNQMQEQAPTQPTAVPAMMTRTVSPPPVAQQQPPPIISYQPPLKPSDPSRITSRRGSAVYHQGMAPDRRSVAGWPTDPTSGSGANGENSWHRKRASVVIPEGTIPVRLWKEDAAAMATTGTPSDDMQPPRSPLTSGPIPRIGVVSDEDGFSGEASIGYRPSVRNGAAVFEGSLPRKPTSRSTSRSRLDDSSIDALAISEAPTVPARTTTHPATYRRKWATGQIAVDSNINTAQGDNDDTEHVVVSLPSPRGCLLENEYPHHQALGSVDRYNQQQSDQDGYEFGMRPHPTVLTHQRGGSTATKGSSIGGGGRRSTELTTASSGTTGGARFTYLDDYREQKQQKKLQQQQQQEQQQQSGGRGGGGGEGGSSDSAIKGVRRRSAQFLQNALKRTSLYQNNTSESPSSSSPVVETPLNSAAK